MRKGATLCNGADALHGCAQRGRDVCADVPESVMVCATARRCAPKMRRAESTVRDVLLKCGDGCADDAVLIFSVHG